MGSWTGRQIGGCMAVEKTLCIIKPDAYDNREKIISELKAKGFVVVDRVEDHVSSSEWKKFYNEHDGKSFFDELIKHMSSGPVCILTLEKDNAIVDYRQMMGATDPTKARKGSLRARYGTETPKNAVHGSDSPESAKKEIEMFFGVKS